MLHDKLRGFIHEPIAVYVSILSSTTTLNYTYLVATGRFESLASPVDCLALPSPSASG